MKHASLLWRTPSLARAIWRNRRGPRPEPRLLTHTVTFTCNARCVMCDSWRLPSQGDLELPEIERIYAQIPRLDVVRLTGGEPFARADLAGIVAAVRRLLQPAALHITTNGFLTERIVRLVEERDPDLPLHLLVSIDGHGDKHDQVRGVAGAWARARATLEALAPRQTALNLRLAVNQTVIDAEGAEHHALLRKEWEPLGVPVQLVVAYAESATYSLERGQDLSPADGRFLTFGDLDPQARQALLGVAEQGLADLPLGERLAKRYYLEGLRARLGVDDGPANQPPCVALSVHLRIFPNGDVPTCQFNGKLVGNLRDQPFRDIWEGEGAQEQRRWVRACPGCWAECEVLPSAFYTGDLLRSLWGRPSRRSPAREAAP